MRFGRHRQHSDQRSWTIGAWEFRRKSDNSLISTFPPELVTSWSKGDSFTDTTGGRDHRDSVYPCDRVSLTAEDFGRPAYEYTDSYELGETFPGLSVSFEQLLATHNFCPLPPSAFRTLLADNAFEALSTQVPQEVSLPNFFWELREIAALVPSLSEGILKTVSGGYLQYQFGWKPFLGDIGRLLSLCRTMEQRLAYLRSTHGRETRIAYSRTFESDECGVAIPDSPTDGYSLRSYKGTFNCGGYLYHELEGLWGAQAMWRAAAAGLGLNNPLGVVWEAIPFSFVADWFGRIGKAVGRTPIQPFVGRWEVRRVTHSWTLDSVYERWVISTPGGVVSPTFPRRFASIKCRRYKRDIGIPASSSWLTSSGLTPQQQLLAAALIASSSR